MGRGFDSATAPRQAGTVKRVVPDRGFGFLSANQDGAEYFFHRSACDQFDAMCVGTAVTFTPGNGPKGPRAESVAIA
jgi:CspA family cold shock protein